MMIGSTDNHSGIFIQPDWLKKGQQDESGLVSKAVKPESLTQKAVEELTKKLGQELAKNTKAVVFGGHPNWQAELKKAAPDYNIVDADNYGFDAKIMDKADVVVIKTDYMAHAQWYKVIERSRKLKKRVVFFSGNSIEELLVKIGEDL